MKVNEHASGKWLDQARRLKVLDLAAAGLTREEIAGVIGRHPSTICRELARNGGRKNYRATKADDRAGPQMARPKPSKLALTSKLRRVVRRWLVEDLSPEQISDRLKVKYPNDPEMRISHETIYQSLYVQSRGRFRKDLTKCLRTGRSQRKPQGSSGSTRGQIPGMVNISERPAEVEDRAVPGHWEGDLILGKEGKSFIGTLVERQTRFVMLLDLEGDRRAENLAKVMAEQITKLPKKLRKTLTWDQGKEMSKHLSFSVSTEVEVYFCDPHSPWRRGSNENTNGLLRQYFPKGTDLAVHGQVELDKVAAKLNRRPRETLGFRTPTEKLRGLVLR